LEGSDGVSTQRKNFWRGHIWGRGYFVVSSGSVTDEVILEYIESQEKEPQMDDEFKIST
jgi:putative transposase